jgi:hypothetical protein
MVAPAESFSSSPWRDAPDPATYQLPDGRLLGSRRRAPVLPCSCASYQEPEDPLGAIIERWRQDRNRWSSGRRLKRAVEQGFAKHLGERGRWLRVSKRDVEAGEMARLWSRFVRDGLLPAYPGFGDWLRVTGVTKTGVAHAHVVWFGCFVPHGWLKENWGRFSGGDDSVWVDQVEQTGYGVGRYLSRQFVDYLAGQGVRAKWSCSVGWRSGGSGTANDRASAPARPVVGGPDPIRRAEMGKAALEFVASKSYRRSPKQVFKLTPEGGWRSSDCIGDIFAELRRRY